MKNFYIFSALLGNLFEHYDTALYGFLSPFLATFFFPGQDPVFSLIFAYSIIPLGMLARPIGSFFFGRIGDQKGRGHAVSITLTAMGLISVFIALLPSYEQVGSLAPVLLVLSRVFQNFFGAGETINGAIYVLEDLPEKQKDFASSIFNASTIAGILLAGAGVSLFARYDFSWRYLYVAGATTALIGGLIRTFLKNEEPQQQGIYSGLLSRVWQCRSQLISITIVAGFSYASYTVALVMSSGIVPLISSISKEEMAHANTALLILDFLMLPTFGALTFLLPREKMMKLSASLAAMFGIPLFFFLEGASFPIAIAIRIVFVIIGVGFSATFHSWAQSIVPKENRALIVSLGYALGSQLIGGMTAALSMSLYHLTGEPYMAGLYWVLIALLTIYTLLQWKQDRSLLMSQQF